MLGAISLFRSSENSTKPKRKPHKLRSTKSRTVHVAAHHGARYAFYSIAVDKANAAHVYVSVGSYSRRWIPDAGYGHVFESADDGATWTNVMDPSVTLFLRVYELFAFNGTIYASTFATCAPGTARSAAAGISARSAVAGSCTTAAPPSSTIRARPSAPSALAPVRTTPTQRSRWLSAALSNRTSIEGRAKSTAASTDSAR